MNEIKNKYWCQNMPVSHMAGQAEKVNPYVSGG